MPAAASFQPADPPRVAVVVNERAPESIILARRYLRAHPGVPAAARPWRGPFLLDLDPRRQ